MGYHTDFTGEWALDRPLSAEHRTYLVAFNETRRMMRDAEKTALRPDHRREAVGLPVGPQGAYFVGAGGMHGQEDDAPDVVNYNSPPAGQPSVWCQWVPNEAGTAIVWDEGEKFYDYIEWIEYLLAHFLQPWGYTISGIVDWQGEDGDDAGSIHIDNNLVTVFDFQRVPVLRQRG